MPYTPSGDRGKTLARNFRVYSVELKKVAGDLRKVWFIIFKATLDFEPGDDKEVSILTGL